MSEALFTSGNFEPVRNEVDAVDLSVVEGKIPSDIDGMYIRNGPNPLFYDKKTFGHWFDGDGMLHGVRLQNGSATFRNRYVKTDDWQYEKDLGKKYFLSFKTLTSVLGIGQFLASRFYRTVISSKQPDPYKKCTANTALVYHDKRLMALVESHTPTWVTAQTLDTVGEYDYDGELKHPFTAHPKIDQKTGEMMFFCYQLDKKPYCLYRTVSKDGKISSKPIDMGIQKPVMMHDMAMTENYSIIMDHPFEFNPSNKDFFVFDSKKPARFGIIPRHAESGDETIWFEGKNGFVFHTANAYEEGDKIYLYAVRHELIDFAKLGAGKNYMWIFDMKTKTVTEEYVFYDEDHKEYRSEFPVINTDYTGYKNRYFYSGFLSDPSMQGFEGLLKLDIKEKKTIKALHGDKRFSGEMSFVPRNNSKAEDDGYMVGFVFDETKNNSELVIYDASDLSLTCRIALPQRVPYGFHGMWVSKEQMNEQRSP